MPLDPIDQSLDIPTLPTHDHEVGVRTTRPQQIKSFNDSGVVLAGLDGAECYEIRPRPDCLPDRPTLFRRGCSRNEIQIAAQLDGASPRSPSARGDRPIHECFKVRPGSLRVAYESVPHKDRVGEPCLECSGHTRGTHFGETDGNQIMDHPDHLAARLVYACLKFIKPLRRPPR